VRGRGPGSAPAFAACGRAPVGTAVLENFGYRQLVSVWRFHGLLRWIVGARSHRGEMTRSAALRDEAGNWRR